MNRRLILERRTVRDLTEIMKDEDILITIKIRLITVMAFAMSVYGCDSWILKTIREQR